jgi:hypothetical protein
VSKAVLQDAISVAEADNDFGRFIELIGYEFTLRWINRAICIKM